MNRKTGTILAAALALGVWSAPADAIMICDCCAASPPAGCADGCRGRTGEGCAPVIVMKKAARSAQNPLNGLSLKYLDLSGLSRAELEKVRIWAEGLRRRAEREFRRTRLRILRGRAEKNAFAPAEKKRDEAIVNYQHIIRAYREALERN